MSSDAKASPVPDSAGDGSKLRPHFPFRRHCHSIVPGGCHPPHHPCAPDNPNAHPHPIRFPSPKLHQHGHHHRHHPHPHPHPRHHHHHHQHSHHHHHRPPHHHQPPTTCPQPQPETGPTTPPQLPPPHIKRRLFRSHCRFHHLFNLNSLINQELDGLDVSSVIHDELPNAQNKSTTTNTVPSSSNTDPREDEKDLKSAHYPDFISISIIKSTDRVLLESPPCTFCLCCFEKGDYIATLHCFHRFHDYCVQNWLNVAPKSQQMCPICRAQIDKAEGLANVELTPGPKTV